MRVVVPTRTICELVAGDAEACAFAPPCPRSTAATVIDPSFTARMRPVTGCCPATVPPPPPNAPRAPDPPRAPVAPVAPVVVVGLCDLSKVMPAANPPPARTSAAAIPITICGAFIFKPLCSLLLVSECLDRMEPRRAHRRVQPEDDSDRARNADRDAHDAARNETRQA